MCLVGDLGAPLERNERVVVAGEQNLAAQPVLQQRRQPLRYVQHQFFFGQAGRPVRAGVVTAVARIEHHASQFQTQRARQGSVAVGIARCGFRLGQIGFREERDRGAVLLPGG